MILAELEVFQSRPIAPTRRVALGRLHLPASPAPGFGGLLLAAVVGSYMARIDEDLHGDLVRLTTQLEAGQRIPQPRLRHRFQVDHIGLTHRVHRLLGEGERLRLVLDDRPGTSPAPQVLAAIYAAGRLDPSARAAVMSLVRRGMRWPGGSAPALLEHLVSRHGDGSWLGSAAADPVAWALGVLGLPPGPDRRDVQQAFRVGLRAAHPDHGGSTEVAAQRIADLTAARRILLAAS